MNRSTNARRPALDSRPALARPTALARRPALARIPALAHPLAPAILALVAQSALLAPVPRLVAQDLDPAEVAERLRTGIADAVLTGELDDLGPIITLARRAVTAFPDDALLHHYAGYALYRLAAPTMDTDMDGALAMLEEATSRLRQSIDAEPIPESHALLATVLGMQITDDAQAMTLGMQLEVEWGRARALGPANPRVGLLEGISAFHTPAMYGGGDATALRHFQRAIERFAEDDPPPPLPAWGLPEAHAWLGQTYQAMGRAEEARAEYRRALELEPGYTWVRDELLPGLPG